MPIPRQRDLLATVVGVLLLILGALMGINLPANQMNEGMVRRDAAIKAMAEQQRQGMEEWRNAKLPASSPLSYLSRP